MENNSASTEFKQLIAKGKEQGYLTIDEINDLIPPDIISGDQLSVFIQTFSDMGITVCETPPEADDILINGTSQPDNEDVDIVANQLERGFDRAGRQILGRHAESRLFGHDFCSSFSLKLSNCYRLVPKALSLAWFLFVTIRAIVNSVKKKRRFKKILICFAARSSDRQRATDRT